MRDQEHQDLYWFTLPQRLRPVLCQQTKSITKKIKRSIQYNSKVLTPRKTILHNTAHNNLAPYKSTLHPLAHNLLHPQQLWKQCRKLLHQPLPYTMLYGYKTTVTNY